MPIDLASETVVTLTEATRHLPRRRMGKRPATQTIYRWAQRGCRGVRLETIQVGGTKCTSLEALQRFCERLSGLSANTVPPDSGSRRRQRQVESAERECQNAGI
jgi:hypothetical protein